MRRIHTHIVYLYTMLSCVRDDYVTFRSIIVGLSRFEVCQSSHYNNLCCSFLVKNDICYMVNSMNKYRIVIRKETYSMRVRLCMCYHYSL